MWIYVSVYITWFEKPIIWIQCGLESNNYDECYCNRLYTEHNLRTYLIRLNSRK